MNTTPSKARTAMSEDEMANGLYLYYAFLVLISTQCTLQFSIHTHIQTFLWGAIQV